MPNIHRLLRRAVPPLLAGLLFCPPAAAADAGTSAATFLQLGFGARALGAGEAFAAVADDASALYYNPAGLAAPRADAPAAGPYEVLAAHSLLIQDVSMTQIGVLRRPFGASLTYLSLGDIEQRSAETAAPEASVGASDMALGLSYARKLGGVALGATGKYVREAIAGYSASAYALDFGALRRFESAPLSAGLSVANVGTAVRFVDQGDPLPTTLRAGLAYGLTRAFPHVLSLEVDLPRDQGPQLRLGAEYRGFGPIALRAGYRTYSSAQRTAALGKALGTTASGLSDFYGMSIGAGLRTPYGDFDYALVPYGELGSAHWFAFRMNFGRTK